MLTCASKIVCGSNGASADRPAFWPVVPMVENFAFSAFSEKIENGELTLYIP
jgi:hypothetical protein